MIPQAWRDLPFWATDWPRIDAVINADPRLILPPKVHRFEALTLTPPERVGVVILGQDPYPTAGHAMGLAFSVTAETKPLPRSLANIFKELCDDIDVSLQHGHLCHWAQQGVLLLNTALTVPQGVAGGHAKLGWDRLAAQVLAKVSHQPTAFILWGNHAQAMGRHILSGDHLILTSAHPSPLSARRGFFGSKPFSKVNTWLIAHGRPPINWAVAPH